MDHADRKRKNSLQTLLILRIQCLDIPDRISLREVTWFTEITTVYRNPDFILNTD